MIRREAFEGLQPISFFIITIILIIIIKYSILSQNNNNEVCKKCFINAIYKLIAISIVLFFFTVTLNSIFTIKICGKKIGTVISLGYIIYLLIEIIDSNINSIPKGENHSFLIFNATIKDNEVNNKTSSHDQVDNNKTSNHDQIDNNKTSNHDQICNNKTSSHNQMTKDDGTYKSPSHNQIDNTKTSNHNRTAKNNASHDKMAKNNGTHNKTSKNCDSTSEPSNKKLNNKL